MPTWQFHLAGNAGGIRLIINSSISPQIINVAMSESCTFLIVRLLVMFGCKVKASRKQWIHCIGQYG